MNLSLSARLGKTFSRGTKADHGGQNSLARQPGRRLIDRKLRVFLTDSPLPEGWSLVMLILRGTFSEHGNCGDISARVNGANTDSDRGDGIRTTDERGAKPLFAVEQMIDVWEMTPEDRKDLDNLPEIVDLWHAHPSGLCRQDAKGVFYLTQDAGWDGTRAFAHTHICAELHGVAIRREYIVAIDSQRKAAQVVLDV